jgi:preprotein translocase subunit Sss1
MTQTKQIKAAEKRCRAAFLKHPNATHAWCCHHEVLFEKLTEPATNRIAFILSSKSPSEQVARLNNFRPVLDMLKFKPARDAYDAAVKPARDAYAATVKPASDAYDAAVKPARDAYAAAVKPARDAYAAAVKTARDAYAAAVKPARDAYAAAVKTASVKLMKIYRQEVPLGTWNGNSIFK